MYPIIENPQTKELFFSDPNGRQYDFNGTPCRLDVTDWQVVGQAPSVNEWITQPGLYGTFNMALSVAVLQADKTWEVFTVGESIQRVRNWLADVSEHATVSTENAKAYSCRNAARSKGHIC